MAGFKLGSSGVGSDRSTNCPSTSLVCKSLHDVKVKEAIPSRALKKALHGRRGDVVVYLCHGFEPWYCLVPP